RAYQGVAHTLRLLRWWVQGSTGFARALGHRPLPLRHPARDGRRRLERHVPTHEVVGPIAPGTGGAWRSRHSLIRPRTGSTHVPSSGAVRAPPILEPRLSTGPWMVRGVWSSTTWWSSATPVSSWCAA